MSGTLFSDSTQWVVLKDLNNKILYYRSYNDGTLKMIDMKKLRPDSVEKSISMDDEKPTVIDKTGELKK